MTSLPLRFSLTAAVCALSQPLVAQTYYWDAIPETPGQQNGGGVWAAYLFQNWYNAGLENNNYWTNSGYESAVFGGGSGNAGSISLPRVPDYLGGYVPVTVDNIYFIAAPGPPFYVRGGRLAMPVGNRTHFIQATHDVEIDSMCDFNGDVVRFGSGTLTFSNQGAEVEGIMSKNWLARRDLRLREGTTVIRGERTFVEYYVDGTLHLGDATGKVAALIHSGGRLVTRNVLVDDNNTTNGQGSHLVLNGPSTLETELLTLSRAPLSGPHYTRPLLDVSGQAHLLVLTRSSSDEGMFVMGSGPGCHPTIRLSQTGMITSDGPCHFYGSDDGRLDISMRDWSRFAMGEFACVSGECRITLSDTTSMSTRGMFYTYGSRFRMEMSGNTRFEPGGFKAGSAVVEQSGGEVRAGGVRDSFHPYTYRDGYFRMGFNGYGCWMQSGGTFGDSRELNELTAGFSADGSIRQTGGTAYAGYGMVGLYHYLDAGFDRVLGEWVVSGGEFRQHRENQDFSVGIGGDGVFSVMAPGTAEFAGNLVIGDSKPNPSYPQLSSPMFEGGAGTVNVKQTTLAIHRVQGITGTGRLCLDGATVKDFGGRPAEIAGSGVVELRGGGAVFHIQSACEVSQALTHPEGQGISSIPLISPGNIYGGPPLVTIAGGGGSGATASAVWDAASRQVSGIVVTNPGSGYTSAPNVQFRDNLEWQSGGMRAVAGTPVLSPNGIPAPIIKRGFGLLSLNHPVNSWTGPVTAEEGLLRINGGFPSSAVTMKTGTQLSGTGRCGAVRLESSSVTPGHDGVASAGILRTGPLTTAGTASCDFSLHGAQPGAGYDQLAVTGTVALGAGARLYVVPNGGYRPSAGDTFFLLINDGSDAIGGTFDGVPEGAIITTAESLEQFVVTYKANGEAGSFTGGNDLAVRYTGQGSPPPVLNIVRATPSGGQQRVRISWPLNTGAEWVLQSTATIHTGGWTNSPLTVQTDAAGKFVLDTVPAGAAKKFYRLRRP